MQSVRDNIKKIEIRDSEATIYYDHATVSEHWPNAQEEIQQLKKQGFIEIQKGNTVVLLPNRNEFPSDIQDLTTLPKDVEDLGWNVLEKFSHVTKFTKDLLRKDHRAREEFQIVQKFSIDSSKFQAEYQEFKKNYPPICLKEMEGLMTENGVFKIKQEEWMEMVFKRGLEKDAQFLGWIILLKVVTKWDASHDERREILEKKTKSFLDLKQYWQELLSKEKSESGHDSLDEINAGKMETFQYGILKDILRTDRDHEYYQMDIAISPSNVNPDSDSFNNLSRGLQFLFYILMTYAMYNLDLGILES